MFGLGFLAGSDFPIRVFERWCLSLFGNSGATPFGLGFQGQGVRVRVFGCSE